MKPAETHALPTRFGRRRLAGAAVLTLALGAALGLALLAAACGGGSSSAKVAQIGTTGTGNGSESSSNSSLGDPLAFSACMRSHGFPSFPDPDSTGRIHIPTGSAIDESSAEYQSALRACHSLVPSLSTQQEARLQEQALHFAACMRSHGVPNFPDPSVGHGHIQIPPYRPGHGVDPNSPAVTAAVAACRSKLTHGNSRYVGKLVGAVGGKAKK
jgi:hypothetical protein